MTKLVKHKWIIILLIFISVIVIDSLVNNVSIVDRGIVVGLALDFEGEEIAVTTQIMLPRNGGVSPAGGSFANYTAQGITIRDALDSIAKKMGLHISLSHTIIVIIGKEIVLRGRMDLLEYFLTDDELSDTCLLAISDENATKLMSSVVPYGEVASYHAQKVLSPLRKNIGTTTVTLKNFFVDYYAKKVGMFLPIIHTEPTEPNSNQASAGIKEAVVFKTKKTLAFNKDCCFVELTNLANNGLSMVKQPATDGTITIESRDGTPVSIKIIDSSIDIDYDMVKNLIRINYNAKTLRDAGVHRPDGNLEFIMDTNEEQRFKQLIVSSITETFEQSKNCGVDIFKVYQGMYRKYGQIWLNVATDDYLNKIEIEVEVKVTQR